MWSAQPSSLPVLSLPRLVCTCKIDDLWSRASGRPPVLASAESPSQQNNWCCRRGVRELALAQSLEKRMGTIQVAIRKAAQAEEKDREQAPKGERSCDRFFAN